MGNNESKPGQKDQKDWQRFGAETGTNRHIVPPQEGGKEPPRLDGKNTISEIKTTNESLKQMALPFDLIQGSTVLRGDSQEANLFHLGFKIWSIVPCTVTMRISVTLETDSEHTKIINLKEAVPEETKRQIFSRGQEMSAIDTDFSISFTKYSLKDLFLIEQKKVPLVIEITSQDSSTEIQKIAYFAKFSKEDLKVQFCGKCSLFLLSLPKERWARA